MGIDVSRGGHLDVKTMAVMAGVVNVLLAVVLYAQYRFNRRYPGVGWWAAGQATVAAGMVVSTLRGDSLAGRIAVPVYQALLVLGHRTGLRRRAALPRTQGAPRVASRGVARLRRVDDIPHVH